MGNNLLKGVHSYYINCEKEDWKLDTLCDLYDTINITQSVVYVNSLDKVGWICDSLKQKGYTAVAMVIVIIIDDKISDNSFVK